MLDGLILRHLVACATASRTPWLPSSFLRVRPRAVAAPFVALHPISLLDDDVTPGWATRMRTAQSDGQSRIGTAVSVRRKALGDGCGVGDMETLCATGDFVVGR